MEPGEQDWLLQLSSKIVIANNQWRWWDQRWQASVCVIFSYIYKQLFDTWNRSDWYCLTPGILPIGGFCWLSFFGLVFIGYCSWVRFGFFMVGNIIQVISIIRAMSVVSALSSEHGGQYYISDIGHSSNVSGVGIIMWGGFGFLGWWFFVPDFWATVRLSATGFLPEIDSMVGNII